jgi:D-sedoheptulose 7-phosphate isomerase
MSILNYYQELNRLITKIEVSDINNRQIEFSSAANLMMEMILACKGTKQKIVLIGNGGSAAIASHSAVDFWKNGGIKAITFNDASLLTCVSNDYSYDYVFAKPIEMFADKDDLLIAISSSGQSKNIINGAKAAQKNKCKIVTLSGFAKENPLRTLGDLNFYVPSNEYGHVEIIHHSICHYVYDMIIKGER